MEDPNNSDLLQPDPLLKPGAFIDPNPASNGNNSNSKPKPKPKPKLKPTTDVPSDQKGGSGPPPPADWLPTGWVIKERVRASGASAGTRDKYYVDPVSGRRFRSKKEVLYFLETGTPKSHHKRKPGDSDADNVPQSNSETPRRKKSEAKAKDSMKNFNFDDVPAKVKWGLTDVYEGTWRPLINGVDRVPESSKQEWTAAFTYLTLQNGVRAMY